MHIPIPIPISVYILNIIQSGLARAGRPSKIKHVTYKENI